MQENYSLTMDVTGGAVIVTLYTPSNGMSQGDGATPEDAILDLAGKIRQEQNRKSLSNPVVNVLRQPMPDGSRIVNVGKIVHYMPGADDTEQPGQVLPAIITREWAGDRMDLQVFNNKLSGTSSRSRVEHSMSANAGTWDWPKKA
jgi:hypothetical protein